jgi:multiple sugar transport system ATP-binding protein
MADRVAVLREGVIQQIDAPESIYHRPANRFVATVVGSPPMNFVAATLHTADGRLRAQGPSFVVETSLSPLPGGVTEKIRDGAPCWVGMRPEAVRIAAPAAAGLPATVAGTEPPGGETVVDLEFGDRVLKALAPPTLKLQTDQSVQIQFDPRRIHLFTEEGEAIVSAAGSDVFSLSRAA